MSNAELIRSLQWALGVVKKKAGVLLYSFADGSYYCAHCESTHVGYKRVEHAEDCEWQRATEALKIAIREETEDGQDNKA